MNTGKLWNPEVLFAAVGKLRVAVVGDLMVDEYVLGTSERISPEAPVQVIMETFRRYSSGGAANTARNMLALGAQVRLIGVVGDDAFGARLREQLSELGADVSGVLTDPARPTTVKTRIIAHDQQVLRMDRESRAPISRRLTHLLVEAVAAEEADGVVISDYAKGVVTRGLLRRVVERGQPVFVDPKSTDFGRYKGATVLTPNAKEFGAVARRKLPDPAGWDRAASALRARIGLRALLITRGAQGLSLYAEDGAPYHVPATPQDVHDDAGCGDTAIAAFTLTSLATGNYYLAAAIANAAGGVVAGKRFVAVATPEEIAAVYLDGAPWRQPSS